MFALLAYAFITLSTGIALLGHVLLLRDIFSGEPSHDSVTNHTAERHGGMLQQEAA